MRPDAPVALPDFRNLGVLLRIVLLAELLRLAAAYSAAPDLAGTFTAFANQGALYEPALLTAVLALAAAAPLLARLDYRRGIFATLALCSLIAAGWHQAFLTLLPDSLPGSALRSATLAAVVAGAILFYFDRRQRVLAPALAEARLMALQARIRPHFLFNSLNSVLGLIREDPRRAEAMLENLADLFRALLAEPRALVPLARELELARAYAEIEAIRLGPRLRLRWQCEDAPLDALLPPMILQPLLENAVYYGVEPTEAGAEITLNAFLDGDHLVLIVRNPSYQARSLRPGHGLALNNISERLALQFDAEARMDTYNAGEEFIVQIRLPYKHEQPA